MDKKTKLDMVAVMVDSYYGFQEPRKAFYNSARNLIRHKIEDIELRVPEDKKTGKKKVGKYIDQNMEELLREILGQDLDPIEEQYVQEFIEAGETLKQEEKRIKAMMLDILQAFPEWTWLKDIRGISNVLAVNLIRHFDIDKARHISSFWKYAGLHVNDKGKAPTRKKGNKLGYNPEARTVAWKIADSFIKQRTQPYRRIYEEEKQRQLNKKYPPGELAEKYNGYQEKDTQLTKGHAHNRATRYIAKEFLKDYYLKLCELYNYEKDKPYSARFHQAKSPQ